MADDRTDEGPIGEDARIDALEQRLKAAREREEQRNAPVKTESDANYRMGNRVLGELLGGLVGGAFLGWVIDQFAGTSPWGLLVMLFMGVVVAFRNIIRIASRPPE
ncbi:AtpZ/AtpI family protein [Novosphingobium piscinae]|uniref:ATP synthase protein I n=1 Tax=Novosphingobium piscinae TaxID=1507448 RepID=A0A7X1KP58_9SPHN|nr:AtpZ/AtpI family protein [Novosphingobium piscinae]MBC2668040.1 AtpZ/AtpI family protein [Novosphingobium piscinae]